MNLTYTEMKKTYENAAASLLKRKAELKAVLMDEAASCGIMNGRQRDAVIRRIELLTDEYCEIRAVLRCLQPYVEREAECV